MGTQLRAYLHGDDREGALELLNLSRPELVMHVHREYAEAGADLLITNTFGASRCACAPWAAGRNWGRATGGRGRWPGRWAGAGRRRVWVAGGSGRLVSLA